MTFRDLCLLPLSMWVAYQRHIPLRTSRTLLRHLGQHPDNRIGFLSASGSMRPLFSENWAFLYRSCTLASVHKGDIITFQAPWLDDRFVTHRVVRTESDHLITRGDANSQDDPPVTAATLQGKVHTAIHLRTGAKMIIRSL